VRCLFIHLKFRHWSLDGSTFVAGAPQFSWTTQFRNGYCTVCVCVCVCGDTRRFRSVIRFLWAKGTAPIEINCEIQAVYGPNVMTVQRVRKWCREFSGCRVSVTDEQRSGRPSRIPPSIDRILRSGFPA
jgi:hypothetical protein